ncbi:cytochrome b [Paraburkholderia sp. SARCC-3016]|jgi:cytochrome b561|uniref:cytochrome b n=1 Tax=Paraburkholderia sp. SARCC-3016 TaxID=3058611 RepID=UPI0028090DB4|nr:cytochrome b [Paraburkholderia sp. SARCC-3016]MDQ7976306.1 cytochrome b [Paraburkholderia sp. SARCC-3016]
MSAYTTQERYSKPAIFFHWAIFLLVATAFFAIEIRGPKGSDSRTLWTAVHMWAGALVLSLAVLRLLWRLLHGVPAEVETNALLTFLARLVHLALYLFIFAQPLLGILMINAGGHPVTLAGTNLQIVLVGADPGARHALHDAHVWLGNAFYWVIGLHALAAIAHQVLFRDRTLQRMM